MPTSTTKTLQLARVRAAIEKIEGGAQSYSVDGHAFTRADLATLYRREERLEALVARQRTGGIRVRNAVPTDR